MRTPLAADHRMDFIDDDRPHGFEHITAAFTGQQNINGFRRRHQDMRRFLFHGCAGSGRGITGSDHRIDDNVGVAGFEKVVTNAFQRFL